MKKFNNKSGFTLIEIIVVLIIVGILAAIALPNLFSNVTKSRGAEAVAAIGAYRPEVEACMMKNPTTTSTNCTPAILGAPVFSTNFSYVYTPPAVATDGSYTIIANGTANGLVSGTDQIIISRAAGNVTAGGGAVTCRGVGQLLGAC